MNKNKIKQNKFPFWFYVIAIFIPILFLVLLEGGLRTFNYGKDYSTFIRISDQFEEYLFFNPVLPQKYFSNNINAPSVIPDAFKKEKPENGFRIFVLGGSSTAGFPFPPNASFPQFLRRKLELLYPQNEIEVVNLGVSAVNTIFIRDIIDEVIERDPDLILIYAGHNEYYGAMGAAGNSSPGSIKRLNLILKDFKIYQLLENSLSSIISVFNTNEENDNSKTLMAVMAGSQLVKKDSEKYKRGINQFEENLRFILSACRKDSIDVLVGKLTSNLKQRPLDTILDSSSKAEQFFDKAEEEFGEENFTLAREQYFLAKEFDALRFRAPENMNSVIEKLSGEFGAVVIPIDSIFSNQDISWIAGYDMFVDHLHPEIRGYKLIADSFLEKIQKDNFIGQKESKIPVTRIDSILAEDFPFTKLDSSFSDFRIDVLLNSYPFKKNDLDKVIRNLPLHVKPDSLALKILLNKISWENAHAEMAEYYLKKKEFDRYYKEVNVLIENKPFERSAYLAAADVLFNYNQLDFAERILLKLYHRHPNQYSVKKLGALYLKKKNFPTAIYYFEKASSYFPHDPELFFNLSNAYFFSGNIEKSILSIEKTLSLNPNYPNAEKILNVLKQSNYKKSKLSK